MYNKIKQSVGRIVPSKRLPDDDNSKTPDEEIDLEQWGPATKLGLGERIRQRGRTFATFGLLSVALFGIVFAWSRQLAMGFLASPVVQGGIVLGVVFSSGMLMGIKRQRRVITESDWLILSMPDGVKPYLGEFEAAEDGTRVFLPYRGFDFLGDRARPLQLKELGGDVARAHAKEKRDPEDPVRIRVDDGVVQHKDTAYGTVVSAITEGLEVDQFGRYSDVYCSPPSQVTEENYRQLREQLEMYVNKDLPKMRREIQMLEQQNENLRDRLRTADSDRIDEFIDRLSRVQTVTDRKEETTTKSPRSSDGSRSNGVSASVGDR